MDMSITFTNHLGKSMTFGAPEGSLHYFANELRNYMYSFDEYNGRAMNFRLEGKVVLFKIGIAAQDEEEGLRLRDELYAVTTADVQAEKRGRLTICGYDMECTIVGASNGFYHKGERWLECELSVRVDEPLWRSKRLHKFLAPEVEEKSEFLDFPFDFQFDFTPRPRASTVESDSTQQGGSDFVMRIYGPCTNPYVQIAGNSYRVNVKVPAGGFLEIDSMAGTVQVVSVYGERTNAYKDRQRGAEGSGSYIFQKIPSGESPVSWSNAFDFDLELFDERSIPPWN